MCTIGGIHGTQLSHEAVYEHSNLNLSTCEFVYFSLQCTEMKGVKFAHPRKGSLHFLPNQIYPVLLGMVTA